MRTYEAGHLSVADRIVAYGHMCEKRRITLPSRDCVEGIHG